VLKHPVLVIQYNVLVIQYKLRYIYNIMQYISIHIITGLDTFFKSDSFLEDIYQVLILISFDQGYFSTCLRETKIISYK